jgi:hypothetical protein
MIQQILTQYVIPLLAYGLITGLANLLLSRKSQVELWAESHPKAAGAMKLLRAVGLDPWQIISAISLWATKKLPDAQRSEGLKSEDPKPVKPPKPPSPPYIPTNTMTLLLCLGLILDTTQCAIFGSHGSFWPKVTQCAPSKEDLVIDVEAILLAGGNYEGALVELAKREGAALVECAVKTAVDVLASKVGGGPDTGVAVARGKAFLAEHPVAQ